MSDAKTIAALQCNLADAEVERLRLVDVLEDMRIRAEQAEARIASVSGVTREELVRNERARVAELETQLAHALANQAESHRRWIETTEELAASHLAAQRRKTAVLAFAHNKMHAPWLKELAALLAEDTGIDANGDAT